MEKINMFLQQFGHLKLPVIDKPVEEIFILEDSD